VKSGENAMEIKTTEDIMYEYVDCNDGSLNLYDINPNVKWIRIEELIEELDKTWNRINKYNIDRHPNYISKTQVAIFLRELKNAIISDSRSSNEDSLNKD
jgi:hypothetical protein